MGKIVAWFKEPIEVIKAFFIGTVFVPLTLGYQLIFPEPSVSTIIIGLLLWLLALIILLYGLYSLHWLWGFKVFIVVLALAGYGYFSYNRLQWAKSKYSRASIVKLHFKESPLLTEQRRRSIQKEIDDFYEYLTRIGFGLSKELPPLGVRKGKSMSEGFVTPGGLYDAGINCIHSVQHFCPVAVCSHLTELFRAESQGKGTLATFPSAFR